MDRKSVMRLFTTLTLFVPFGVHAEPKQTATPSVTTNETKAPLQSALKKEAPEQKLTQPSQIQRYDYYMARDRSK